MLREIPRGVEVLIKKAAVDPAFKKQLLEKRARAADAIALTLSPAEKAMLEAVPEAQLRAIVANTKVSPGLRPAFLGYAAAAMLAALGASAAYGSEEWEFATLGSDPEIPPKAETVATADMPNYPGKSASESKSENGKISGSVKDNEGNPLPNVLVTAVGTKRFAVTNGDGDYFITPVPAGVITVETFSPAYGSIKRADVKILPGYTTSLNFQYTNPPLETPEEPRIIYNQAYQGIRPDGPQEKDK